MTDEMTDRLLPERYRSFLIMLARVSLRDLGPMARKVDASDVVQEALLQAHVALPEFHGTTSVELRAWLRTILANKLTDAVRYWLRGKRDVGLEQTIRESVNKSDGRVAVLIHKTDPGQRILIDEKLIRLAETLETLPEDQCAAVELRHLYGYSVSEIASQMGRTKPSVAGLLRRGLSGLREQLEDLA